MMLQLRSRQWSVAAAVAAAASSCRRRAASAGAGGAAADAAAGEASARLRLRLRRPRRRSPGTGLPRSPDRRCSGTAAAICIKENKASASQLAPRLPREHKELSGNKRNSDADTHLRMPGAERQRQVLGDLQGRWRRRQHLGLLRARVQLPPGGWNVTSLLY